MGEEEKENAFKVTDKRFIKNSQEEEEEKEKERGFKVTDKRSVKDSGEKKEKGTKREEEKEDKQPAGPAASTGDRSSFPELNFSTFILSLSTSAMFYFGDIPDPVTKNKAKNLPAAKETIDILDILKEKTKGNLTQDEEGLIDDILYNLRMRYVKVKGE
ncbi:MAG: DUF1844 domain-containing protein [Nitrospinota bacterium]